MAPTTAKETTIRDLLILGTGVHCQEMVEIIARINGLKPTWNLIGLVAPDASVPGVMQDGTAMLGGPEVISAHPGACVVPGYGWPKSAPVPRERLITLVDPSAFVSRTARIGPGSTIYPNCFVGLNATIGERVFCLCGCVVNHDCVLEDGAALASSVALAGSVHVEADCYLGQSSTVRQGVRIGHGSMIGMGAVVIRNVVPNSVIVGNPGRLLRVKAPE